MASILSVQQIEAKDNSSIFTSTGKRLNLQNSTEYFGVPYGSTLERNIDANSGSFRWNEDTNTFEFFDGIAWRNIIIINDYNRVTKGSLFSANAGDIKSSYPGQGNRWYNNDFEYNYVILQNSPQYSNNDGGFISFDGTNHYGIFKKFISATTGITLECWFKPDTTTSRQTLISTQYGFSANAAYYIGFDQSNWRAGINILGTLEEISHPVTTTPLVANNWYHFLFTYNSTDRVSTRTGSIVSGSNIVTNVSDTSDIIGGEIITGSGLFQDTSVDPPVYTTIVSKTEDTITLSDPVSVTSLSTNLNITIPAGMRIYVNGEFKENRNISGSIEYNEANVSNLLAARYVGPGSDTGVSELFDGNISDFKIYNRNLREVDILLNYNSIKGRYGL